MKEYVRDTLRNEGTQQQSVIDSQQQTTNVTPVSFLPQGDEEIVTDAVHYKDVPDANQGVCRNSDQD